MLEKIILLLLGGSIGFIFKLLYDYISLKKPRIVWRIFPEVHLPSKELSALNIIIENRGAGFGKNVNIKILFASDTEVSSFEIKPSESALKIESSNQKNEINIFLPQMPSNQGFLISILTKGGKWPDCKVSIIGDDNVVGKEALSEELFEKRRTRQMIIILSFALILLIISFLAIITLSYVFNEYHLIKI